ncbi:hypothetical protein BDF19DRAFT_445421, partial [Syncephalis fuscata]
MTISKFEAILAVLPLKEKDVLFQELNDAEILELECASRSLQITVRQSSHYWRSLYGRTFHWRYAANEEDFLLWYRNMTWRRYGRPAGSEIDLCHEKSWYTTFLGINWRLAYKDRRIVEKNWREKRCKSESYNGYMKRAFWYKYCRLISASNLPLKILCRAHQDADHISPSATEILVDIANSSKSVISTPSSYSSPYFKNSIKPIFVNGYYTAVEFNSVLFVRPTYSEDNWLPIDVEGSVSTARIRTYGRWVIMTWEENNNWNVLMNLTTGHSHKLPHHLYRACFIMEANENSIVLFSHGPNIVVKRLEWRQYHLTPHGSRLQMEKVRRGKFHCDHIYEDCRVFSLGLDYIYAICGPSEMCTLSLYTTGKEPSQDYICSFTNGRSGFRIDPTNAVIQFDDCYMIIDLTIGDATHFIDLEGMIDICPILGRLVWCEHNGIGQVKDIYSGEPAGFCIDGSDKVRDDSLPNYMIRSTFCISTEPSNEYNVNYFTMSTSFDL